MSKNVACFKPDREGSRPRKSYEFYKFIYQMGILPFVKI